MSRLFEYTAMASIAQRADFRALCSMYTVGNLSLSDLATDLSVFGLLVDVDTLGLRIYPERSPRVRCAHIKLTHQPHPHLGASYLHNMGVAAIAVYAAGDA